MHLQNYMNEFNGETLYRLLAKIPEGHRREDLIGLFVDNLLMDAGIIDETGEMKTALMNKLNRRNEWNEYLQDSINLTHPVTHLDNQTQRKLTALLPFQPIRP
jgi:hypothetical protein